MATITKRGKTWQARLYYYDEQNKRKSKAKSGFKTKKEAQLYASKMTIDKQNGDLVVDEVPLFCDYFWKWYETYKEKTISDRTKRQYIHTYNILKKFMPNIKLDELNREIYQKFLDDYGSNHARETVSKINALVHSCVKDAIYDGYLKKDFVQRTTLVYDESKTLKIEYLSIKEMKQLVSYLLDTRNSHFSSKYMILLAIYTGMRLGEIQGLQWQDIDFKNDVINIKRSWNAINKKYIPTKTKTSVRSIAVNKKILEVIKELKDNDDKVVFLNQYKTIPTSSAVNKTLRETLSELNITKQGFHFHSLRHTHVAYLLANNVDIYVISKRLGHSDIGITTRIYSYMIDEYKNRANDHIKTILNKI